MAIEHASTRIVHKPWGRIDLRPWFPAAEGSEPVGEIWFERDLAGQSSGAPAPELLLKLLFTSQNLSIQVHPDDAFAHTMGQPHGKTEAWLVLAAEPGAEISIGLKQTISAAQLRLAINNGTIAHIVDWQPAAKGDVISVPAGTIHAIGAGLVLAEIQQRSDTTFRLFDYGRGRDLHIDEAVAVATCAPAPPRQAPQSKTDTRTILAATPYFILERIELAPAATGDFRMDGEAWLLVLDGHVRLGAVDAIVGEAIFISADGAQLSSGPGGFKGLLAYNAGNWLPGILTLHAKNRAAGVKPAPERALS